MQLVASELNAVPHSGGSAVIRSARGVAEEAGISIASLFFPGTTAAIINNSNEITRNQMATSDAISYLPVVGIAWDGLGLGEFGKRISGAMDTAAKGGMLKEDTNNPATNKITRNINLKHSHPIGSSDVNKKALF